MHLKSIHRLVFILDTDFVSFEVGNEVVYIYIYIYINTHRCPRRKGQNFGRVFFMLKYTDITQNTYIPS
jgi:hypothetical protein